MSLKKKTVVFLLPFAIWHFEEFVMQTGILKGLLQL